MRTSAIAGLFTLALALFFMQLAMSEVGMNHYSGATDVPRSTAFSIAMDNTEGVTIVSSDDPTTIVYKFESKTLYTELTYSESNKTKIHTGFSISGILVATGLSMIVGLIKFPYE